MVSSARWSWLRASTRVTVDGLVGEVIVPSVIAPILAIAVAATATFIIYRRIRSRDAEQNKRSFRVGQV